MISQLHTIIAEVSDMDRAATFYRDVLGLEPQYASPHWSSFKLGGITLGLHPPFGSSSPSGGNGWVLSLATDDIVGLRVTLEASGTACTAYHETPAGVVMDFCDPDGNRLQAMQVGAKIEDLKD